MTQAGPPVPSKKMPLWVVVAIVVGGLVAVLPFFAVFGIYGVRKYIANAKTAEARATVAHLAKLAAEAHAANGRLCPSTRPVPASVRKVANSKYQSSANDWVSSGFAGCLRFRMENPQYYAYAYTVEPGGQSFVVTAEGDLNGDGVTSRFAVRGEVAGGAVELGTMTETDPEE
jgi:type IV pilus assembly protein PilA